MDDAAIVLNWGDVLLRASDLALLAGPRWINDSVMLFHVEWLRQELLSGHGGGGGGGGGGGAVQLLGPDVAFLLASCNEDDARSLAAALPLDAAELAVASVNDDCASGQAGGTHWR